MKKLWINQFSYLIAIMRKRGKKKYKSHFFIFNVFFSSKAKFLCLTGFNLSETEFVCKVFLSGFIMVTQKFPLEPITDQLRNTSD